MDGGPEDISDPRELAQVRAQARKIQRGAVGAAIVLTALAMAVPGAGASRQPEIRSSRPFRRIPPSVETRPT